MTDKAAQPGFHYERPQLNTRFLLLAAGLSLLWLLSVPFTSSGSKAVLAVIGLTFLFGCWRTRRAVLWIVPAMYLPYAWLIADWQSWPWRNERWQWIASLWQLPGMFVQDELPDRWFQASTAAATIVLFLIVVTIARRSLTTAIVVSLLVLLVSICNSGVVWLHLRFY